MTQFQQKGFEVVKGFIPPFFSAYLRNYFTLRVQNEGLGGDTQAPNSHCVYGDPAFDMVMAMSTQDIGKIVGKNLVPQYTYARIYKNGSVLERHSDRPECQYSITLCLVESMISSGQYGYKTMMVMIIVLDLTREIWWSIMELS